MRCPSASGENVTLTVQLAFGAYAPLHPLTRAKSPGFAPPIVTEEMCSVAGPELVSVTICAVLVTPCRVLANVKLPGAIVTAESPPIPVPVSKEDCVPALSVVIVNVACRGPAPVGAKLTLTEHVEPAPEFGGRNACGEHVIGAMKSFASGPVIITPVTVKGKLPMFVTLMGLGPTVCPISMLSKS